MNHHHDDDDDDDDELSFSWWPDASEPVAASDDHGPAGGPLPLDVLPDAPMTSGPATADAPAADAPTNASNNNGSSNSALFNGSTAKRTSTSSSPTEGVVAGSAERGTNGFGVGWGATPGSATATPGGDATDGPGPSAGIGMARTSHARWAVAVLAGVAVAVLAVLGVNAVASAATSAGAGASVFGPFVPRTSHNPPFSASGGRSNGAPPVRAGAPAARPAPVAAGGAEQLNGTIGSIDGDRIDVTAGSVRTVVELSAASTIHDGSATIPASALRVGETVRVTGTREGSVLHASTVAVVR